MPGDLEAPRNLLKARASVKVKSLPGKEIRSSSDWTAQEPEGHRSWAQRGHRPGK